MPLSQESLIKEIPLTAFPPDVYLIVRTLMLLRGLCHALQLDIKVGGGGRGGRMHATGTGGKGA